MTDRELLELAAKAAGHKINASAQAERDAIREPATASLWINGVSTAWNPLTNDGDALRLAVKLRLSICHHHANSNPAASVMNGIEWGGEYGEWHEFHADDALSATRRAIVRAAAEIGRLTP